MARLILGALLLVMILEAKVFAFTSGSFVPDKPKNRSPQSISLPASDREQLGGGVPIVTPPVATPPPPVAQPNPQPSQPDSPAPQEPEIDMVEMSQTVGLSVDKHYGSMNELMDRRPADEIVNADRCHASLQDKDRFAERITFFVSEHMKDIKPKIEGIGSYYSVSQVVEPSGLIRHPMCNVTASTLSATLGSSRVPSSATILKANTFVDRYNSARQLWLSGNHEGKRQVQKLWTRLFSCLAYVESLSSADTSRSYSVANSYAPSGYRKPAGVSFYEDPAQDAASRLNIGLFQFTPTSSGNINPCLKTWNSIYPSCSVNASGSQSEMIRLFGSGWQTMNAFCGVNKVLQTFSIQLNTSSSSATHPYNVKSGKLVPSNERCVSLHFRAGAAYNHFGPFQNSAGDNLDELLTCALKE